MSTLRRTFKVAWNGGPLVEVTSNARDMAAAQDYANDPAMGTFALIHHALKRTGHEVPSLDGFIDTLDEMQPGEEDQAEDAVPTLPAGFGREPLPYPSKLAAHPIPGLTITEPSSQQNVS